jgi:hypothetical protein
MELRLSQIRYSQDSIRRTFYNGVNVEKTNDNIIAELIILSINDLPAMDVARKGQHLYTVDNRRMWDFQQLENWRSVDECTWI